MFIPDYSRRRDYNGEKRRKDNLHSNYISEYNFHCKLNIGATFPFMDLYK